MSDSRKKVSGLLQFFKRKGIEYLIGTPTPGLGIQAFTVASGGSGDAIVFASTIQNNTPLKDMADTDYMVLVSGETAAQVNVDESSKETTGFTILGGGSAEVLNVVVIGRIEGMPVVS